MFPPRLMTGRRNALLFFLLVQIFLFAGSPADSEEQQPQPADRNQTSAPPGEHSRRFELVFEPRSDYTDLDLIIALTENPIPQLGEKTESEIYTTLLSRAAILPQFLVLEASVNPMPYLGTYIREHDPDFYGRAQISGSFNWIKALTAGFEEPWALSLLAGNVANFQIPGSREIKGLGYSGYLFSAGNYHIKDNTLIKDYWQEYEWKMKGDRKSQLNQLSWSFRIGAKMHSNPNITDIYYVSLRRSRIDFKPEESSLFSNSGFEYTYDMDRRTFSAIRHYFFVDRKWPLENSRMAFSVAVGFVWESVRKYTGALAAGRDKNDFQFLLRPNVEF